MQPHLKKCFEGIAKLTFTEDLDVTEMKSSEGEVVPLEDVIQTTLARGQVEKWLLELEADMKKSVHKRVQLSIEDYPIKARDVWVLIWPGQIVIFREKHFNLLIYNKTFHFQVQSVAMSFWTGEVTESISHGLKAMSKYYDKCDFQISKIVDLVRGKLSTQNRITLGNFSLNYT